MKFVTSCFLALSALVVMSLQAQDSGTIKGKVSDAKDSRGVEADVKLFGSGDSTLVKGARSDSTGVFSIDNVKYGTYRVEVTSIGYSSLSVHNVTVSSPVVSMDTLHLKKAELSTDEILVEENKGLIQFSGDKKIFNVNNSIITKGGTAIDVLKKTPLVDVDINDNVSMRGSQNVKILIDDKPMRFASLKQVPADAIERIELITNPSAKYEAEGVTGIINIVLKKNDRMGITGSFNGGGNYSDYFSGWGGTDINIKKKKTTFFGNFYSGNWRNNFFYNSTTNYFNDNTSLKINGGGKNHGYWIWGQGGFEYEASPKTTLGFEGSVATGRWYNTDTSISNSFSSSGALTSYYEQPGSHEGLWENFTGSLYFNNKIDDQGREWTGDITLSRNRNTNFFAQKKLDFDPFGNSTNSTPLDQKDSTHVLSYNLNVQTDYTHPLSKDSKLETGYKGTFRTNDNDFSSDTLDYNINGYVADQSVTNRFKLSEYINAGYGMFSSTIGGFTYKLGVRAEYTHTIGELTGTSKFTNDYVDFFPTVNLSMKVGQFHQAQLSYSRRVTRPNIWRMNPFFRKFAASFAMVGNPELKPEYTDSYELSFMLFTKAITVTPLAFFRANHDVISSYSYLADTNLTVSTFRNATGSKAYGLDLLLNSRAFDWLSLNGTFSFYNTKFDSDPLLTDYAVEEGFSWKANVRSTLTFTGLFNLELFYQYTGKKVNFMGTEIPSSNFDIGISKSFFKDALTISLRAGDIFNTATYGQNVNAADYSSSQVHDWSSRQGSINISYRFGNTDEYYQKKKKQKQNQNEKNDQGDNNGQQ